MKKIVMCVLAMICCFVTTVNAEMIRIACSEYPPFEYTDEDGNIRGFSVEIMRAMLKDLNMKDTVRAYPWKRAYHMGLENKNTVVFSTTRNKDREALFSWVGPIMERKTGLYKLIARTDVNVATLEDAKNYTIGVVRGYASEKSLLDAGFEIGTNIEPVTTHIQNVKKIYANRIDFIACEKLPLAYYLKTTGHRLDELEEVLSLEGLGDFYYAFNKDTDKRIVEQFRKAFEKIRSSGMYDKIKANYLK